MESLMAFLDTAFLLGCGSFILIMCSGVGAGVIIIPLMVSLLGIAPLEAVATGSLFAVITKILIMGVQRKIILARKDIIFGFLKYALPSCLFSAFIIIQIRNAFPSQTDATIKLLLVAATVLALLALFDDRFSDWVNRQSGKLGSAVTGGLVGLTGVGGGVFVVPLILSQYSTSIKIAVAASIPIGLVLSASTGLMLSQGGFVSTTNLISMSAGAVVAIPFGILSLRYLSESWVRRLVTGLVSLALTNAVVALFH